MKILFVCTSNFDRSPALENRFRETNPQHEYRSAGINEYHTAKKGTRLISQSDIDWADFIVYCEVIHLEITEKKLWVRKPFVILRCGEYVRGGVNNEYIAKAEFKIKEFFNNPVNRGLLKNIDNGNKVML